VTNTNQKQNLNFYGLGIAPGILEILKKIHYVTPTPIQHQLIPIAISGKDAVGIAQDVVFVGARQRMELWNPDKWQAYEKQHAADYEQKLGAVVKDVFGL